MPRMSRIWQKQMLSIWTRLPGQPGRTHVPFCERLSLSCFCFCFYFHPFHP